TIMWPVRIFWLLYMSEAYFQDASISARTRSEKSTYDPPPPRGSLEMAVVISLARRDGLMPKAVRMWWISESCSVNTWLSTWMMSMYGLPAILAATVAASKLLYPTESSLRKIVIA